ncbi:MAG TPA: trypsin-like peptidase domain-containing protein [Blastocatellia bacterium]|nr:trypsin-like peptidase domain-containing protein [Blastocatellia bacterium]
MNTKNPSARALTLTLSLVLSALLTSVSAQQPNATNKLHMYSKPAIVRIISGYAGKWQWQGRTWSTSSISSGSGSIINPDGYILTNAHVVSAIREGDDAAKQELLGQLAIQVLREYGKAITRENVIQAAQIIVGSGGQLASFQRINYVFLQSGNRYPYEIKAYGAPVGEGKDLMTGKDVAIIKIEIKNAPTLRLGNSDKVQVGDKVYVIGYPGAADSDALDEKSQLEPTTNDGSISAKKNSADGAPILQTNTSTTHGNSGGPAINDKGEVIGLLTFRGNTVNGQEVQGFNFIVPTSTALEFVRQAGVDNKPSTIDAKWREGLEYFWKQEYSDAKEKFTEVLALYPNHSEAQKLISEAQEHIAKGEDRSGSALGAFIILVFFGGGFLVVVGGAIAAFVFVRRKKPSAAPAAFPAQQAAWQQQPHLPHGLNPPEPHPQSSAAAAGYQPTVPLAAVQRTEVYAGSAQAALVCTAGPLQGQSFPIGQGLYIGRDSTRSQVVVQDAQVSGQHLWVGIINGHVVARDVGSTNGTYLNNQLSQRITEVQLNHNDRLTLGRTGTVVFTFQG